MDYNPLISIIVPVYRAELYFSTCLDSILAQTYKNIEIIIVDDESPDNCGAISDAYKDKDSRVKVIHKKNGGASSARNIGLDIATGDYIGFVDADDYIHSNMYECLYRSMKVANVKIGICGFLSHYSDGSEQKNVYPSDDCKMEVTDAIIGMYKSGGYRGFLCNKLFEKSMIDRKRLDEGLFFCEDLLFVSESILRSEGVIYLAKPMYHYNIHSKGMASTYSEKRMTGFTALQRAILLLDTSNKRLFDLAYASYFREIVYCLRMAAKAKDRDSMNWLRREGKPYMRIFLGCSDIAKSEKIEILIHWISPVLVDRVWGKIKPVFKSVNSRKDLKI